MTDRTKALVDGPPETIDGFEVGTTVAPNTTIVGDADLYDVPPEVEAVAVLDALVAENERLVREVRKQRGLRDQYREAWEDEKARAALKDAARD